MDGGAGVCVGGWAGGVGGGACKPMIFLFSATFFEILQSHLMVSRFSKILIHPFNSLENT